MANNAPRRRLPESYFALVRELPLTHIQSEAQLDTALGMIDRLLERELDGGAQEYLDALTDLVEIYEDQEHPIPDAPESDVLRELMAANRISQGQLAKKTGISQSTISAVLTRKRSLTKEQVVVLAKVFNVSASAFLHF